MKIQALLVSTLVALAGCSPAQGDCTQECSTVSNDCAVTYVACRTGCGGALDALPSLTAPACVSDATAAAVVMAAPVVTDAPTPIVDPLTMMTPAPEDPTSKSGYCRAAWVCDDNYIVCGSKTIPYGGCYDVCKGNTITPPTCTIPPVPEAAPVRGGLTQAQLDRMKKNAADRLAAGGDPCHEEDKSRCKPANW